MVCLLSLLVAVLSVASNVPGSRPIVGGVLAIAMLVVSGSPVCRSFRALKRARGNPLPTIDLTADATFGESRAAGATGFVAIEAEGVTIEFECAKDRAFVALLVGIFLQSRLMA